MFMPTKNYRASWMVQDGSSARSIHPERWIHGSSPDVVSTRGPQFGHTNSIWAPSPAKTITTKHRTRPSPSSLASTTFRGPARLENWVSDYFIFDVYSTTLLWAHPRTDIWTITYRAMHRPSNVKTERLQVQSGQKEEALCCIETQEFMLYMVYRPPRYHPHFFTSKCIILKW